MLYSNKNYNNASEFNFPLLLFLRVKKPLKVEGRPDQRQNRRMPKTELYIGRLDRDVNDQDIESTFSKYGAIKRCDLKNKGKTKE